MKARLDILHRSAGVGLGERARALLISTKEYCVRLRAMIMPLCFQVLHDFLAFTTSTRQPVPQEFQGGTPEQANAFFEDLVQVAHLQHKNFVAMLERAVEVFSFAESVRNHVSQQAAPSKF